MCHIIHYHYWNENGEERENKNFNYFEYFEASNRESVGNHTCVYRVCLHECVRACDRSIAIYCDSDYAPNRQTTQL